MLLFGTNRIRLQVFAPCHFSVKVLRATRSLWKLLYVASTAVEVWYDIV